MSVRLSLYDGLGENEGVRRFCRLNYTTLLIVAKMSGRLSSYDGLGFTIEVSVVFSA